MPFRAAEDAVGRPALPPCRTAGARRCPRPLPRLRDVARRRVAGAAHRYRPPLAREAQAVSSAAVSRSAVGDRDTFVARFRSEEHTSELQSLMRISYAVFCLT